MFPVLPALLTTVTPDADPVGQGVTLMLSSALAGDWPLFVSLALGLALLLLGTVAAARAALGKAWPWVLTPRGGVALNALAAGAQVLVLSLAAGVPLKAALSLGLSASLGAAGLRTTTKSALKPAPTEEQSHPNVDPTA